MVAAAGDVTAEFRFDGALVSLSGWDRPPVRGRGGVEGGSEGVRSFDVAGSASDGAFDSVVSFGESPVSTTALGERDVV